MPLDVANSSPRMPAACCTGKFASSRLVGTLANLAADLPSRHLQDTSLFKAAVAGDRITAERKFAPSFEFWNYARLLFSANQPPRSDDASHGYFRRWLVLNFEKTFDPASPDFIPREVLDAELAKPEELSGLLNRALDELHTVLSEGFTETASTRQAHQAFMEETNPIAVWLEQCTTDEPLDPAKPEDSLYAVKATLHRRYNDDCIAKKRPPVTKISFGKTLKRLKPGLTEGQKEFETDGKKKMHDIWWGIRLRSRF